MKIFYISNSSPTTKKAHGLQIAKMCEALADAGAEVELLLPDRSKKVTKSDYFGFFGIRENFKLRKLPVLDLVRFRRLGFLITAFFFGLSLRKYIRYNKPDLIYTRDPFSVFFISNLGYPVYFEAHKRIKLFLMKKIVKSARGIVTITEHLASDFKELGFDKNRIIVAPDGVDFELFDLSLSKEEARIKLGLPLDKKICLYSGNLKLPWKGVGTVIGAAKLLLGKENILFILMGIGRTEGSSLKNILYVDHKPHTQVPLWLKAADILLLPNTGKDEISRLYTSPLKMFEYMASGNPIVASRLESIEEILNDSNACLIVPDDHQALNTGIRKILSEPEYGQRIALRAYQDVRYYTWQTRVEKILQFVKQN